MDEKVDAIYQYIKQMAFEKPDIFYSRHKIFEHFNAQKKPGSVQGVDGNDIDRALAVLSNMGLIKYETLGNETFRITTEGYLRFEKPADPPTVNQIYNYGSVSHSAFSQDRATANVNIRATQVVDNLIREIESSGDLTQEEKTTWLARLNEISKDPRLLTLLGVALGSAPG